MKNKTHIQNTFKFYQDPGHGWLAVKIQHLKDLRMLGLISSYSYMKGQTVYLEEDSDMIKFLNAYEGKNQVKVQLDVRQTDKSSPIRSYGLYKNPEVNVLISQMKEGV